MASIANMLPQDVVVLRDGVHTHIEAKALVPGDLVCISLGDKVRTDVDNLTPAPHRRALHRSLLGLEV